MSEEELKSFDFYSIKPDQDVGYIFQCNLTLPTELHSKFNSFPLWPQKKRVSIEELSLEQQNSITGRGIKLTAQERLLLTLYPKCNDVFYGLSLKFFLENGYELKEVIK
jgi:hypothetical protein